MHALARAVSLLNPQPLLSMSVVLYSPFPLSISLCLFASAGMALLEEKQAMMTDGYDETTTALTWEQFRYALRSEVEDGFRKCVACYQGAVVGVSVCFCIIIVVGISILRHLLRLILSLCQRRGCTRTHSHSHSLTLTYTHTHTRLSLLPFLVVPSSGASRSLG